MARVVFLEERCKGCLLCATACPKGVIRHAERFNPMGYKVVEVPDEDMDECTGCASCAVMCPDLAVRVFRPQKKEAGND